VNEVNPCAEDNFGVDRFAPPPVIRLLMGVKVLRWAMVERFLAVLTVGQPHAVRHVINKPSNYPWSNN
jgi:hypothetical protein